MAARRQNAQFRSSAGYFNVLAESSPQASPSMSFSASPCVHSMGSPLSSPLHGFVPPPFQLLTAAPSPVPATALAPGTYLVNAHVPPSSGSALLPPNGGRSLLNLLPQFPQGGSVAPAATALEEEQPALRQRANTEPFQRAITEPPPGQTCSDFIRKADTTELAVEVDHSTIRPRASTAHFVSPPGAVQPRVSTTRFVSMPAAAVHGAAYQRSTPAPLSMACVNGYAATSCAPSPTGFVRQLSPASPVNVAACSPTWTTVVARPRRVASQHVTARPAAQAQTASPEQALGPAGEAAAVDLYYDQKELFARGWSRSAKQSRSVKMKKRVDYQIDKRRQQSLRDKAANMTYAFDEEEDEW